MFKSQFRLIVCALLALPVFAGCVSLDQYGKLDGDAAVRESFMAYEVDDNHTYYVWGSRVSPDVIIAIEKDYPFNQGSWIEVKATPERLRGWIGHMQTVVDPTKGVSGAKIYDNQGKAVGFWLSSWREATVIFADNNALTVQPVQEGVGAGGGGCG